jgi:hypothetical protein
MDYAWRARLTFPDFEEFIASLNAHRVRYLVVGGYAVGFHARPRATKDIDLLVDRTAANARRTLGALRAFLGANPPGISVAKLTNPRTLIVLGVAPVKIDILTSIDGVPSFADAWKRRVVGAYGAVRTQYLGLEDLIASKTAAGRLQDLADAEVLRQARARPVRSRPRTSRRP